MRKNQRYSKEEMFTAIELWQKSGLTQVKFCAREQMSVKTFGYWLRKYKNESGVFGQSNEKERKGFIPVNVSEVVKTANPDTGKIHITFPNGVQLSCPAGIDMVQLKALINF